MNWKKTCERYVAFFDILGFKDMVIKNSYPTFLKEATENIENIGWVDNQSTKLNIESDQTKSITLPDSILLFSKGSSIEDFYKIMIDAYFIKKSAIKNNIAIKAVVSYGNITVDFERALYLGQPIIDARLLHEDLFFLCIVLDDNARRKIKSYEENNIIKNALRYRQVKMEFGSVTHTIISMIKKELIEEDIFLLKKLYDVTSAVPRHYIDNTIDYYKDLLNKNYIKVH